jgi:hypothetical protein
VRFRAFAAASGLIFLSLGAGCFVYGEDLLTTGGTGNGGAGAGSTTDTTGTSTAGMPCKVPEDCPATGECQTRTCANQTCGTENLAPNTEVTDPAAGDCHSIVCDSAGGSIEVENSKDILDDGKFCTVDSCELGKPKHAAKFGFACNEDGGKHCNAKGDCVECAADGDCASKVCKDDKCAPASCSDMTKNGSETDVDCGGACADCASGKDCLKNTDCKSADCTAGSCQSNCMDGATNNSETDVDCGGPMCPDCADGKVCAAAVDCKSGICSGTTCAAPACNDGLKNGDEGGVDCGGLTCASCPLDHIVINEVDYDQVDADVAEFVEIYNATTATVSLANYKLVLVNGMANTPYGVVDLAPAGALAAGQYLVVMTPAVVPAAGALTITFAGTMNQLQNGSPDGLALIDDAANVVIDAISYEGAITAADLSMWGLGTTVSLVEGAALNANVSDDAGGSLCRLPNSKDTNSSGADWAVSAAPTPGAANKAN